MQRAAGILFGGATHLLFAVTVWHLFWFLKGGPAAESPGALWVDALLAAQFAVIHSLLLLPRTRQWLGRWIPGPFYGCFYCVATCGCLLGTFHGWQRGNQTLWEFTGAARTAVELAFYASWGALFYSLALTGLGYQTGWTPFWAWLRKRPLPPRRFVPRGAYLWLRHPVYLSFLGLIWFTPAMTGDRAVLTVIWTTYIFVGSYLKDERLAYYVGAAYRDYQAQVGGYPLIWWGPLARLSRGATPEASPPPILAPRASPLVTRALTPTTRPA